jgi:hypothetical protein
MSGEGLLLVGRQPPAGYYQNLGSLLAAAYRQTFLIIPYFVKLTHFLYCLSVYCTIAVEQMKNKQTLNEINKCRTYQVEIY